MATVRLLIADDHSVVRQGLRMYLALSGEVDIVGEARNGAEAVAMAESLHPDVVLMDLSMPVMDGVAATSAIAAGGNGPRVLVLTSSTEAESVLSAIRAGAVGYVLKDAETDELARAIRAAAAGHAELSPEVAGMLVKEVQHLASLATTALRAILFTDVEGHSAMMARLGDERGRDVMRDYERITRDALEAHGGQEVKALGDGHMAWFGSASGAIECGLELQRDVARYVTSGGEPLRVRVGINAGEPISEGDDLFGAAVVLASRLANSAGGGQVLVSNVVKELVAGKDFCFTDRGEHEFRGFDDLIHIWEVGQR